MSFGRIDFALLILTLWSAGCSAASSPAASSPVATAEPRPTLPARVPTLPVVTPSIVASPAPAARQFSEDFGSTLTYWHFLQVDNGQPYTAPTIQDGFLVFDLSSPNQWAYGLYSGAHYADAMIETEVQSRTSGDGAAGLICRYDEKKGWYEFDIFADRTYQLLFGQWLAPGLVRYVPLTQGTSEAIQPDSNQIGLRCQGSSLEPFINGAPLRKWPELKFGLEQGEVGLAASSFADAPFLIAFDWASVSEP